MSKDQELFERAISEAYERQVGTDSTSESRRLIVKLGRRRRVGQLIGSTALLVVIATSAALAANAFQGDNERVDVVDDAKAIGSEQILGIGGPMAANDEAIYVANSSSNNDAADKGSIARIDLESFKVKNTDPVAMSDPQNVALGSAGLWLVGWSGDLSHGDHQEGHPHGRIQLADPDSGEVLLDLPRDNSAPYDVVVAERQGREMAWVADAERDQLLVVDPASGAVESIELDSSPISVSAGGGAVWVVGDAGRKAAELVRYDLNDGSIESYPVDHCLGHSIVVDTTIWGTNACDGRVHSFDAATGKELSSVALGDDSQTGFGGPFAITFASDTVWVASGDSVQRIDPDTSELVGDPIWIHEYLSLFSGDLIAVDDTVFVSSMASGVYRLGEGLPIQERPPPPTPEPEETKDPLDSSTCTLSNVKCIPLDREWSVAGAGFGTAWVGNVGEGKTFGTVRFDAETGEEVARLDTDGFVQGFSPDGEWMWAIVDGRSEHLFLLKIDPTTTTVSASYDLGHGGNVGDPTVVASGGYAWVSLPKGEVARISGSDGEMTTMSYADQLPGLGDDSGPVHLAYGDERLWLSYGRGHLGEVDPSSGRLIRLHEDVLGENAYDIIVAAGAVWSSHQSPFGDNEISYTMTAGPDDQLDRVLLRDDASPGQAATDGERVWVVQSSFEDDETGWLVEVDGVTHEMVGEPLQIDLGFQGGVAYSDGYVWVTGNGVLYRISPTG